MTFGPSSYNHIAPKRPLFDVFILSDKYKLVPSTERVHQGYIPLQRLEIRTPPAPIFCMKIKLGIGGGGTSAVINYIKLEHLF